MSRVSRTRWALLALVLLALAGFLVLFVRTRPGRAPERAPSPPGGSHAVAPTSDAGLVSPLAEAPRTAVAPDARTAREVRGTGTGVLDVRFVDARDGAPVAGAACCVFTERGTPGPARVHAQVTTDANGRARVEGLPEATMLVHAPRSARHANATKAIWLPRGAVREVELALDEGGSVVGRVVDDEGAPLAGAEVELRTPWPDEAPPRADLGTRVTTDASGHFELPRVRSEPRSVWIRDGEARPENWEPVSLSAHFQGRRAGASVDVRDVSRADVGDIVIVRGITVAGRVLDAGRRPVPGARVVLTLDATKPLATKLATASSTPDGTTTDEIGAFRADGPVGARFAGVLAPWGAWQAFVLPTLPRGGSVDGLELVLSDDVVLQIELLDENGDEFEFRARDGDGWGRPMTSQGPGGGRSLTVEYTGDDAAGFRGVITPDPDRRYRIQMPVAVGNRHLRLSLPTYLPVEDELAPTRERLDKRRYVMRPYPPLRLHVTVPEPGDWARRADLKATIDVHACLLAPARRAATPGNLASACCGLGARWTTPLAAVDEDVSMPVASAEPFHVYVRVTAALAQGGPRETRTLFERTLGPTSAREGVVPIAIPPLEDPRIELAAPEPRKRRPPLRLEAQIVDAESGRRVDGGLRVVGASSGSWTWARRAAPDQWVWEDVEPGRVDVQAVATGYRDSESRSVLLSETEVASGGTFALVPHPRVFLTVVEADGRTPPANTQVVAAMGRTSPLWLTPTDGPGRYSFRCGEAGTYTLRITSLAGPGEEWRQRRQVVNVELSPGTAENTVHLAPWRACELLVGGAAVDTPDAPLMFGFTVAGADSAEVAAGGGLLLSEASRASDGRRRFVFQAAAGRYVLKPSPGLLQVEETVLEVRNSDELQRFELSSSR